MLLTIPNVCVAKTKETVASIGDKLTVTVILADNVSLIAMASKVRPVAYCESLGFRVTRQAPVVEHPPIDAHGDALLAEARPR